MQEELVSLLTIEELSLKTENLVRMCLSRFLVNCTITFCILDFIRSPLPMMQYCCTPE